MGEGEMKRRQAKRGKRRGGTTKKKGEMKEETDWGGTKETHELDRERDREESRGGKGVKERRSETQKEGKK